MSSVDAQSHRIKLLPEHLIDQIKAGEVVERPASLLKELIENSIDAQATKIDIHLVNNGMDLIKIEDNGHGMSFEDLPYAFGRHATSKIDKYDDLFNLHSFGFRGEALASISAVSRITCTSIPNNQSLTGGKIQIAGGKIESHSQSDGHKIGTSLYIKDLFFNTPVRLKFLKSQTSEKNAIMRIINAFVLSNIHVEFSVKFDEKDKIIYPIVSQENFQDRVKKVFFKKSSSEEVFQIQNEYDGYKLLGFISKKASPGYSGKKQFLFANNRFFQDKPIHQNIIRQAEKLWGPGQTGHYAFMLEVPVRKIDVNIHPNKTQIKFQDNSIIYTLISSSIKEYAAKLNYQPIEKNESFDFHQETQFESAIPQEIIEHDKLSRSFSSPMSRPSHFTHNKAEVVKIYTPLTNRFLMKKISDDQLELIDSKRLFIHFWMDRLNTSPLLENILSPLLITEPFYYPKGNIDNHFDAFKDIGFELERVEDQLIVLRSIPTYLNASGYLDCLRTLIENANNQSKKISKKWFIQELDNMINSSNDINIPNENAIDEQLNNFEREYLIKNSIIKIIDNNLLLQLIDL